MSHGTLYVRFPDGTVRYGLHGSVGAYGRLFDHPDQAWTVHLDKLPITWWPDPDGPVFEVEIADDYGLHWSGKAAFNTVEDGFDPYDDGVDLRHGEPLWAVWPEDVVDGSVGRHELEMGS